MSSAPTHAESLRAEGIDPESFLKIAQSAAETAMGRRADEGVERLARFAREVHAAGFALYFPFESCALPLARVLKDRPDDFLAAIDEVAGIAADLGEKATKTIQVGVRSICEVSEGRPFVVMGALGLARRLSRVGLDPGETLLQAVFSLAEIVAADQVRFDEGAAAIGAFAEALGARGVHGTYPIQQGLCGVLEAWREDPGDLPEALCDLADLVAALQDAGISPYHVMEYGVSIGLPSAKDLPWLRRELFPLAVTLAGHGIDPTMTLQGGIHPIAYQEEGRARAILAWAQALTADGVDPGWFLEFSLWPVVSASESDGALADALEAAGALGRALSAHGHDPASTFRDGLPEALVGADTVRLLAVATALAVQGFNPGPSLAHGFATLRYACAERPIVADAAMGFAERLVAHGQSPWHPLEYGLPAVLLAAGDDDGRAVELLETLGTLLQDVHSKGIETKDLCLYGIGSLGRASAGDPALFETLLGLLSDLVGDLESAGFSPIGTVGNAMPAVSEVAGGDRAFLEAGVGLARTLARGGIDPAPFLVHAVPALGPSLLGEIASLASTAKASGVPTEPLGEALAALGDLGDLSPSLEPEEIARVLALCEALAADGIDVAPAIKSAFPAALQACTEEHRGAVLAALDAAIREAHRQQLPFEGLADTAFEYAAQCAGSDPVDFAAALTATLAAATEVNELDPELRVGFLSWGTGAAARVAGSRPDVFTGLLGALAEWAALHRQAPGLHAALVRGLSSLANAAGDSPETFRSLLGPLASLTAFPHSKDLFEHGFAPASLGAEGDAVRLHRSLGQLATIGALCEDEDVYYRIGRLKSLVAELPEAWDALIVPACAGGNAGVPAALDCVAQLRRYLREAGDLDVVREIVTQYGVRAPDLLNSLILEGLYRGLIHSLADERETLLNFLTDVPFPDVDYYVEYRRIMGDEALAPADRRAKVAALGAELHSLMEAVVSGEVTPEEEQHLLFGQVLSYVFPPARTMSRAGYLSLYRAFEDRPQDVAELADRGPMPAPEIRLATGGYRIKDGSEVDRTPWAPLLSAVLRTADAAKPEDLASLGEALFSAWIEGTIGKHDTRDRLLGRIYALHRALGSGLPNSLDDAGALLKYREFLSDTCREIVQDALAALRATDPERYERQVRAKLTPRRRVGKGLIRGVLRTAEDFTSGALERGAAIERLGRQLKTSDLSDPRDQDTLLALHADMEPGAVAGAIESLPEREIEVSLGEEHHRVLTDLTGAELAAMQRELFGEDSAAGKLEYSPDSGGPEIQLRMEVTKRRAHAPIGICEGVCTATDTRLWATPAFMQCVFWGEGGRARGGMHLLRVERTIAGQEERALLLPGINPSLELLREVGPDALLDAALRYAQALVGAWDLRELWIPTSRSICTNRGPIRLAMEERGWSAQQISTVAFSYSPYRYAVDEVWVVPALGPGPERGPERGPEPA